MWVCNVRPPANRISRCLPRASTSSTSSPTSRSARIFNEAAPVTWRPAIHDRSVAAVRAMVSPSGVEDETFGCGHEARGAQERLEGSVDPLDRDLTKTPPAEQVLESLDGVGFPCTVEFPQRDQALATALHVEGRHTAGEHDVGAGGALQVGDGPLD